MSTCWRRYVRHFNYRWRRSETSWEGRFKSCLVHDSDYLLQCYRYKLNPVRAGMVEDPAEYRWSSYQTNGLGLVSSLCTPHPEYLALGDSSSRFVDEMERLTGRRLRPGRRGRPRKEDREGSAAENLF